MVKVAMTPEMFAAKLKELQADGVSVTFCSSCNNGTAQKDGVSAAYTYDWAAQAMTCNITKKPMFLPLKVAESKLKAWLTA